MARPSRLESCYGTFEQDNTIIATAIPKIADVFKSIDDIGWYGSAYLLTTCAFTLLWGKMYVYYSVKWIYLAAIVVFEVGSAVCGAAPTSSALSIGRAVAGMGSAGIFTGALTIIAYTVPLVKRPIYTGFIGAMYTKAEIHGSYWNRSLSSKHRLCSACTVVGWHNV